MTQVVHSLIDLEQEKENVQSRVHAIGWNSLRNWGNKGKLHEWTDLVPYPQKLKDSAGIGLSGPAKRIIKSLISKEQIDNSFQTALLGIKEVGEMFGV